MCPTRGETATAFGPNTGTMCRFSAQYWIIATPREARGSASGGSTTIFGRGCSLLASGIIDAGLQLSLALCAPAAIACNTTVATNSKEVFRFAIFLSPMQRWTFSAHGKYRLQCTSNVQVNAA